MSLFDAAQLVIRQRREIAEVFGFETRNKYEILSMSGEILGFAAEQQKGLLGFLLRQFLGHWRSFEVTVFNSERQVILQCRHPFRFFFQRFEIFSASNQKLGALQSRWAIFRKRFDIEDAQGRIVLEMTSPFFKFWTFPFYQQGREVAVVRKKWSGFLKETLLDADNFQVEFLQPTLTLEQRQLVLAASLFIDLQYFEHKAD